MFSHHHHVPARQRRTRLALEIIEQRQLLAIDVVSGLMDSTMVDAGLVESDIADSAVLASSAGTAENDVPALLFRRSRGGHSNPISEIEPRSIDGAGNNLTNAEWGSTGEQLLRVAPADYADGLSAPAGEDRPSAREISNAVAAQIEQTANDRGLSAFIYVWGQFLDHAIDVTTSPEADQEVLNIPVPAGDAFFDPDGTGTPRTGRL